MKKLQANTRLMIQITKLKILLIHKIAWEKNNSFNPLMLSSRESWHWREIKKPTECCFIPPEEVLTVQNLCIYRFHSINLLGDQLGISRMEKFTKFLLFSPSLRRNLSISIHNKIRKTITPLRMNSWLKLVLQLTLKILSSGKFPIALHTHRQLKANLLVHQFKMK